RGMPRVLGAAPRILGQGLISVSGETQPVQVKGIDLDLEPAVTNLKEAVTAGSLDALKPRQDDVDGIMLGKDLAAKLGVATGDSVSLTLGTTLSPVGLLPRTRRLKVAGVFSLGLIELDSTQAFLSLAGAPRVLNKE